MTYHDLLSRLLPSYTPGEARAVLRMVLEDRFGLSWNDILIGDVSDMGDQRQGELESILRRLERHEPVQYVLGEARFCDRRFIVSPATLIPRPETEDLVMLVNRAMTGGLRVLDIGTGGGCIAVTLAADHPDWHLTGLDISGKALAVARLNADKFGVKNIDFIEADILSPSFCEGEKRDVIVSNPPYVLEEERCDMAANVLLYEPSAALFVPDDCPLLFYNAVVAYARTALRCGGQLWFETNTRFAADVKALLDAANYRDTNVIHDRFGKERIVYGTKQ